MIYLALAGLILTFFAAVGAKSLSSFSRHELEEICQSRKNGKFLSQVLSQHEEAALAAEILRVIGIVISLVFGIPFLNEIQLSELPEWLDRVTVVAIAVLPLLFVITWLPRPLARLWAAPIVYFTWPIWRFFKVILTPLSFFSKFFNTFFHRLAGRQSLQQEDEEDAFEDEIRTIVTEGHREGLLEEDAREMIEGVIELSDVDVSEIMTPRTDMKSIPKNLSWDEMIQVVSELGHSRIPVYNENRDDIVGILVTKDLLQLISKNYSNLPNIAIDWTEHMRDPYFIPETKPVDVLLQEFQQTHNHMVIVLDEYGGVSGLVTMEDVLEEIVGEIIDEHDTEDEEAEIVDIDENTIEVLGKTHIDKVNERLNISLPDELDFDTIGGFAFTEFGHIPLPDEQFVWQDRVRVSVLNATRRRITKLRVEILES